MGRAKASDVSILISGRNDNADAFVRCIFNSVFNVLAVVSTQTQVNDLCSMIRRVADSRPDGGTITMAVLIQDTNRQNVYIQARRAVDYRSGNMGSVQVHVAWRAVVVNKIVASGKEAVSQERMLGDACINNSNRNPVCGDTAYMGGQLVCADCAYAP